MIIRSLRWYHLPPVGKFDALIGKERPRSLEELNAQIDEIETVRGRPDYAEEALDDRCALQDRYTFLVRIRQILYVKNKGDDRDVFIQRLRFEDMQGIRDENISRVHHILMTMDAVSHAVAAVLTEDPQARRFILGILRQKEADASWG